MKEQGKIKPPRTPYMQGIRCHAGLSLCFLFLLGCKCKSKEACGYHLEVRPDDSLPGSSQNNYEPFHDWLKQHSSPVCLTAATSKSAKLSGAPSPDAHNHHSSPSLGLLSPHNLNRSLIPEFTSGLLSPNLRLSMPPLGFYTSFSDLLLSRHLIEMSYFSGHVFLTYP